MDNNVLISIIVPVYNTEKYIRNTILSVEEQTYRNIELICVDDGTKDKAFEICRYYSTIYNNIILLQNELHQKETNGELTRNHGIEYTRNNGIKHAHGQYIMFLDSDDTLEPNTIERLLAIEELHESDVVLFTYSDVRNHIVTPVLCPNMPNKFYSNSCFCEHLFTDISYSVLSCVGSKLYNLSFLRNNELWFEKKYKYNEDAGFIISCLKNGATVYFLNEPLYNYFRRSSGSTMTSHRPHQFSTIVETRSLIKDLFIKHKLWDEKKDEYYEGICHLMYMTLNNDLKYGTKNDFYSSAKEIYKYEDFAEAIRSGQNNRNLTKLMHFSLFLLKHYHIKLLYMLMRLRICIKG